MLLIHPNFDRKGKNSYFDRWVAISLPTGVAALAGYLLQRGKKVKILDEAATPINDDILSDLLKKMEHPYIFGISCVTPNIIRGYEIAEMLKTKYQDSKVIMGGIHPTVLPEEALKTGHVDVVVRREGEEVLNLLYEAIKNRRDYTHLKGISFINGNKEIVHNPDAPLLKDLREVGPFPYHLFEPNLHKYNLAFTQVTRGCPYDCIFCSSRSVSGRAYRYLKPEEAVEHVDVVVNKYGVRYIYFQDDNFAVNKEWTIAVCERFEKRGYPKYVKFCCSMRGDNATDEILAAMKRAGFVLINYGIETASERLMKLLNKGETVEDNIRAVKLTKK
ncbi:MAG: B12-binding domain-containing radical SAM protein [Deltaproteobacteria bacterium]|nr:B12-binding domain-containing radical SAM protein [Deltaproteobacteria bacterium]